MAAAPPIWHWVLTDLAGTVLGELTGATERSITLPMMRLPTATFTLPLWHPLAYNLTGQDTLLQCWRSDGLGGQKLAFHGPVLTVNEAGSPQGQSVAVSAFGPFWRLSKRVLGATKAGVRFPTVGERELGLIAFDILDIANSQVFTGISKGFAQTTLVGATGVLHLKKAAEAIAELTTGLNSFEFDVRPTPPTFVGGLGGWPQLGVMDVAPLIGGIDRPDAVFEYGTSRANVASYERSVDRQGMVNASMISVSGWPDATAGDLRFWDDNGSIGERGLYQEVIPDGGVTDLGLRDRILAEHILHRAKPRTILNFSPSLNARPAPFTDFNLGDFVRARAQVRNVLRFDETVRVWGITFNLDPNGNETNTYELVMP